MKNNKTYASLWVFENTHKAVKSLSAQKGYTVDAYFRSFPEIEKEIKRLEKLK